MAEKQTTVFAHILSRARASFIPCLNKQSLVAPVWVEIHRNLLVFNQQDINIPKHIEVGRNFLPFLRRRFVQLWRVMMVVRVFFGIRSSYIDLIEKANFVRRASCQRRR